MKNLPGISVIILPSALYSGLKRCFILCVFLLAGATALPQENILRDKWSCNTAFMMPGGKWETGIFQQFRLGLSDRIELRVNAITVPVIPNAGVKVNLGSSGGFQFASEHYISIPSVFLNIMSSKGTGGLISPQYSFGFITSLTNTFIVSKPVGSSSIISADAGLAFALRSSKPDYQSTIDIPFIYQRMAHWYDGASIRTSVSYRGIILKNLFYEESCRVFIITRESENLFIENSGSLMLTTKGSIRIKGGYMLSWGRYPFGNHIQMWPAFDFIFGSKVKR